MQLRDFCAKLCLPAVGNGVALTVHRFASRPKRWTSAVLASPAIWTPLAADTTYSRREERKRGKVGRLSNMSRWVPGSKWPRLVLVQSLVNLVH